MKALARSRRDFQLRGVVVISLDWLFVLFYGSSTMSTPTIQETIQKLREDFRIKQKQAEIALQDKIGKALLDIQQKVLRSLAEAHDSVKALGKDEKEAILSDESIKDVLSSLGYVRRKKPSSGGTRGGGKYDEAAILAFLADGEKEQKLLLEKFGVSKQSIGTWGKTLSDAGKVKIVKHGRERVWRKV